MEAAAQAFYPTPLVKVEGHTVDEIEIPYWSVIGYHRWWQWLDGPELGALQIADGLLSPLSVRRIALAYRVSRGIRRPREDEEDEGLEDPHAAGVADLINNTIPAWLAQPDLVGRAAICIQTAEAAAAAHHTRGIQVSAFTKLFWFVGPAGWTVFDRFAADALGAVGARPVPRATSFYQILSAGGFAELSQQGNQLIQQAELGTFRMERILDQQLWLRGLPANRRGGERAVYEGYLAALPPAQHDALSDLAHAIAALDPLVPVPN